MVKLEDGRDVVVVRKKRDYKPTAEQKKVTELLRKGYSMQAAWDEVKGRKKSAGAAAVKKRKKMTGKKK